MCDKITTHLTLLKEWRISYDVDHVAICFILNVETISKADPLLNYFKSISEDDWRKIEANPPEDIMDLVKG